jgi:hypothetical protein
LQFSSGIWNAIKFMFFLWFYYCILLWSPFAPFCVCNVCFCLIVTAKAVLEISFFFCVIL